MYFIFFKKIKHIVYSAYGYNYCQKKQLYIFMNKSPPIHTLSKYIFITEIGISQTSILKHSKNIYILRTIYFYKR